MPSPENATDAVIPPTTQPVVVRKEKHVHTYKHDKPEPPHKINERTIGLALEVQETDMVLGLKTQMEALKNEKTSTDSKANLLQQEVERDMNAAAKSHIEALPEMNVLQQALTAVFKLGGKSQKGTMPKAAFIHEFLSDAQDSSSRSNSFDTYVEKNMRKIHTRVRFGVRGSRNDEYYRDNGMSDFCTVRIDIPVPAPVRANMNKLVDLWDKSETIDKQIAAVTAQQGKVKDGCRALKADFYRGIVGKSEEGKALLQQVDEGTRRVLSGGKDFLALM